MTLGFSLLAYSIALIFLTYFILQKRAFIFSASIAFLWLFFFFHGPALLFYTEAWGSELKFGLFLKLINEIDSEALIPRVYFAMTICIASVLIGIKVFDLANPRRAGRVNLALSARWTQVPLSYYKPIIGAALFCEVFIVFMLVIQFTVVTSPSVLVDYYFSQDIGEFDKVAIRRNSALGFYPYQVLLNTLMPFVSYVLLAERGLTKSSAIRLHAVLLPLLLIAAKLSYFNKAGPILYLLQIFLVVAYARTGTAKIGVNHLKVAFLGLIALVLITINVNPESELESMLGSIFERLLMIPNEVIFEYFSAIPAHLPFGYGRGISWVAAIVGDTTGEGAQGTYWHVGAIVRGDYGSTSNALFVSDAWAEFSWPGVIIVSLIAGVLLRWHDFQVTRWGHSSIALGLLVASYAGVYTLLTTSITTAMFTGGLVLTPLMARVIFRGYLRKKLFPSALQPRLLRG